MITACLRKFSRQFLYLMTSVTLCSNSSFADDVARRQADGQPLAAKRIHRAKIPARHLEDIDAEAALREVNACYRRRVDALFARDQHLQGQTQELWHDADRDA